MASDKHINLESMLPTGSILHGNYRIDGYLSSGGFGNTYVATHILFNETYAIKEFFMKDISERGSDSSSDTSSRDSFRLIFVWVLMIGDVKVKLKIDIRT